MKLITGHLGQIIAVIAAISLLITSIVFFKGPVGLFFENIIEKETSIGDKVFANLDNVGMFEGEGGSEGADDGSGEASQLDTPSISITGSVLTITPVENATEYEIYNGDELLVTTNETTVELSAYLSAPNTYALRVRAIATGYNASKFSTENYVLEPAPGLYQTGSNYTVLLKDWNTLISEGFITNNGTVVFNKSAELAGDLVISNQITTIVEYSYYNCNKLTNVVFPNSATSIERGAFYDCDSLESVVIPGNITTIGSMAFYSCHSIESVVLKPGVTNIGNHTFTGCAKIKSITIPNSVTSIGTDAFSACESLTSVGPVGSGASVEIPNNVTFIDKWVFSHCTGLKSVVLPAGITSINYGAFYECTSIESVGPVGSGASVEIPDSVTTIDTQVFDCCTSLKSVEFPASVTSIGGYAECTNLESITIPAGVTSIGDYTFKGCTNLESITFKGTVAQWNAVTKGDDWKYNVPATKIICSNGEVSLT